MEIYKFYPDLPKGWKYFWYVIGITLFISTLGIGYWLWYDRFILRKYYLNRKLLYKYLTTTTLKPIRNYDYPLDSVREYYTIHEGFRLWIWLYKGGTSLHMHNDIDHDIIGLFTSTPYSRRMERKLIKLIEK